MVAVPPQILILLVLVALGVFAGEKIKDGVDHVKHGVGHAAHCVRHPKSCHEDTDK